MTVKFRLPVAAVLLIPTMALAKTEGAPDVFLYALGGGAAGGFLGALLACWLCKRMRSKSDRDSER